MAFREPMGFAPAAVRRRASSKPKRKAATKPGVRRKATKSGGRTKTRGSTKKTSAKETGKMAKRRTKRRRTAAQKAATRKMLAANRRRRGGAKKNPTRRKASRRKPIGIRKSKKTGATSVVRRGTRKMSPRAETYTRRVSGQLRKARGKKRTTIYRTRPSGKVTKIIRENPANRTKAIVSAVAGFSAGYIAADMLDRYIATRAKGENGTVIKGKAAVQAAINKKASGTRIFAQAAGTGVSAVGAYMLRKKSVVGTYLLGGMAAAFATKAFAMVVKDHLMPALMEAKPDSGDFVARMGYGSVSGPRGYMGAPRPFQGKPTVIGPQAGSVGSYGCTRSPVSPSAYYDQGGRENCKPWPFTQSDSEECIDKVSRAPSGGVPPMSRQPRAPVMTPTPGPRAVPTPPSNGGGGGVDTDMVQPSGEPERRVYQPRVPPMAPATPKTPGRMPSIRPVDRIKAQSTPTVSVAPTRMAPAKDLRGQIQVQSWRPAPR
jgi:hypothetical protein